jgi:hypothetical protein
MDFVFLKSSSEDKMHDQLSSRITQTHYGWQIIVPGAGGGFERALQHCQ